LQSLKFTHSMVRRQYVSKHFCHIFENLFNERWLIPSLYGYYKPSIIVSGHRGIIVIRDLETGQIINTLCLSTDNIQSIIVHDGLILAGGDDQKIHVWDIETGLIINTLSGHTGAVLSICMGLNGRVLTGSADKTIKTWDLESGELIRTFDSGHTDLVRSVCVDTEHNIVVSGSRDRTIRMWDLETGKLVRTFACVGGSVMSVCLLARTERSVSRNHNVPDKEYDQIIVSGSYDNTVKIWDAETGRLISTLIWHMRTVRSVCTTTKYGNLIISGSNDCSIKIWSLETGQLIRTLYGHMDAVTSVLVHDNLIISGSDDGVIKTWDLETGVLIRTFLSANSTHSIAIQ
jgi:WD40 repeat protein